MRHRALSLFAQAAALLCGLAAGLSAGPKGKPAPKVFTLPTFPEKLIFIGGPSGRLDYSAAASWERKGETVLAYDAIARPHYLGWGRHLGRDFRIWYPD